MIVKGMTVPNTFAKSRMISPELCKCGKKYRCVTAINLHRLR